MRPTIFATALRPSVEARIESVGDRAHMEAEAALRRQARGENDERGEAERPRRKKRARRQPCDERDRGQIDEEHDDAQRPPGGEAQGRLIGERFQPGEPAAHPSDGMADRAIERRRIADQRLDDRGGERERQRKRKRHGGIGLDREASGRSPITAARSKSPAGSRPRAPEPWIDLSTGVNPHAYPLPALEPEAWSRLPESEALAKLEAAAARRYGAAAESVIAGPGSQALIQALAHILPRGEAGALGRTYGGFAAAFAAAGGRVVEAKRLEDMDRLDVAIVVNPNNPDGRIVPLQRPARAA